MMRRTPCGAETALLEYPVSERRNGRLLREHCLQAEHRRAIYHGGAVRRLKWRTDLALPGTRTVARGYGCINVHSRLMVVQLNRIADARAYFSLQSRGPNPRCGACTDDNHDVYNVEPKGEPMLPLQCGSGRDAARAAFAAHRSGWRIGATVRSTAKRHVKSLLGRAFGIRQLKRSLGGRAAILGLHSITDEDCSDGDPVRVPATQLRALCRLLKEHFTVISLTSLVAKLESGADLHGEVAISFDDGYKDNHELAAPVLSEFNLPATFFVTTGFVGSAEVPFWEAAQKRVPRWMTWRDVADLANHGFEIGAHSTNHRDLGRCFGSDLAEEIERCKTEIENRLSVPVRHFAFPFGGKNNYSSEAIEAVKRAGYRSAVTCCGGVVSKGDSLFTLGRLPYSAWYLSPYQFMLDQAREYRQ